MAGQEEVLKLVAQLQDQFSPQLKQMQRSLRSLAAETAAFTNRASFKVKGIPRHCISSAAKSAKSPAE